MKRILSFLMAFTLLISSFSNVAFAEEASGETTGAVVANAEDGQTVNVNLRVGQTVTYSVDGSIVIDNPDLDGLNTEVVTGEVVPGETIIKYPYSAAKLATGMANFSGDEVELEECLFTFEGSDNNYIISHTKEDGSKIYLAHYAVNTPGFPCKTTESTVVVGEDNGMFTLMNNNSYLYFWNALSANGQNHLCYDKNGTKLDTSNYRTHFYLFTPDASADSAIKGYRQLTGLNEIVSGQQYLIASKVAGDSDDDSDDKYYILRPVVGDGTNQDQNINKWDFVAEVVTYNVPGVQLASAVGTFDVAELKKVTDCLFTFTKAEGDNKYIISAETEEGTKVYVNVKPAAPRKPTSTAANNVITLAKKSDSELFSLHDSSGGYLYFHRDSNYHFNRNSSANETYCYFELYEPSESAPANSPIKGFTKVTSLDAIKDEGQYLIAATSTAATSDYYFMYPSTGTSECEYVAKLTDDMLESETEIKSDSKINFTAVAPGNTSVTVGGVTYSINVAYTEDRITLKKGESFAVSGPLQIKPGDESIISTELINNAVAPYTKVDAIADGYYLIGNADYIIENSVTSADPSGLAMESANYAAGDYARYIWKVTAVDGGYTIQDINGKYINFGAVVQNKTSVRSVVLSTKPQVLTIAKQNDGTLRISYENYKLNNYGSSGTRRAAAWNGDDSGNAWNFYAGSADAVKVTSVEIGTATFAANGYNYTVTCNPADYTALNSAIASAKTLVKADYFTKEWRVFESVLGEVEAWVSANSEAIQPEVDAKQEKLADAMASLRHLPVYTAPNVNELAQGAPTGTTEDQPFADGTAGSNNFRIPAMITLSDGTIIAAADARWNHSGDACSIDIMLSKSTDNGKTWKYSLPAFFNDSTNEKHEKGACFIDPVLVRDANDKIYMMVDLFPGGVALNTISGRPHAASGFVDIQGEKRLVLYTSNNPDMQNDTNYDYYVADYEIIEGKKLAPIYEVYGEDEYSVTASYYMDSHFYLYTAEKEPMYCEQLGDTSKKVQQNVFFYNSILHVRYATYLYLITSEDKGETWSEPMLLNSQIRKEENPDIFYGVGPGAGLCLKDGTIMLPAYTHSNERASFIYSTDGGTTWERSQDATTSQSSESCLVQLNATTVRHFYRSNEVHKIQYTDHTLADGKWIAGEKITLDVARNAGNQVSAIRYSKTIDDKPVIIFSTASVDRRQNGKLYVFTVDMTETGKPMTLVSSYDVDSTTEADKYAYSCIAELADGSIGLLYESDDTEITYKTIPMDQLAPDVVFDTPVSASPEGVKSELLGHSLVLKGNIGLNFYMRLGEDVTGDPKAKMIFTLERKDGVEIIEVPVIDVEPKYDKEKKITYYIFECPVPVKDMDTNITGQIILADGSKGFEFEYAVKEYIDYMLENDDEYADEVQLVSAMNDFGAYAATYFADGTEGETPELPELPELSEEDMTYLEKCVPSITGDEENIYVGSSLLLKTNTVLRHYFTESVDGYNVIQKDKYYYIESAGIDANDLNDSWTVTIGDMKIEYSPLSYAQIVLTNDGIDEELKNLMNVMYQYHKAAMAYNPD